jgi:multimeric flavodoxin WrbA
VTDLLYIFLLKIRYGAQMNREPEKRLLVVWWSRTGASEALANACVQAALATHTPGLLVSMRRADQVVLAELLRANGLVFVCPENLGTMAGMMKEFFDLNYYLALGRLEGVAYQVIVSAGSDGTGAVRQIERIATGWRLRSIGPPLIVNVHAQEVDQILAAKKLTSDQVKAAGELGTLLASGLGLGIF